MGNKAQYKRSPKKTFESSRYVRSGSIISTVLQCRLIALNIKQDILFITSNFNTKILTMKTGRTLLM